MAEVPETRYARSGEVYIAHQVVGEGDRDIVFPCDPAASCELLWDDPIAARGLRRLAGIGRLILFDIRGAGASSPMFGGQMPPLQTLVDDLALVMDETGSASAAIFSPNFYAPLALMFAAAHPHRTEAVLAVDSFARFVVGDGYPHGLTTDEFDRLIAGAADVWGTERNVALLMPSRSSDRGFVRWAARAQRLGSAPPAVARLTSCLARTDLRPTLPSIQAPVLLLTHRGNPVIPPEHSRYLAEHLAEARLVELDDDDLWWYSTRADVLLDHVESFLTGRVSAPATNRVLATVLFTDIVDSTARAQALGDHAWTDTLSRHDSIVQRHVETFGGRWIKSTGDGALATFDAPARAVLCADGIRTALDDIGIAVRGGLHTGEIEQTGDDIAGLAVHVAARITSLADAHEILVSSTIPSLVVGSSVTFTEHGTHTLKGIAEPWRVLRLVDA